MFAKTVIAVVAGAAIVKIGGKANMCAMTEVSIGD